MARIPLIYLCSFAWDSMKPEEKGAGKHQRVEGVDGQSGMTTENVTRAKGF